MKAWDRNSPDIPEEPHRCMIGKKTCTIGMKFWFSVSGSGTITDVVGWEKKSAKERLRACEEGLSEDRTIPACSKRMYEVIVDFGRGL
jgi:hypothetical protein